MSPERGDRGIEIGPALKDARRRIGMEIKEAEDRTKIRAKYLRALEAEDWEVLPAPAYVRGFLRTYGQILGLDGEMLADEFRRRHEAPAAAASPASEPVLRGRQRTNGSRNGPPSSRGTLIAGVAAAIVVLLVVLSLLGGDDEPEEAPQELRDTPARDGGKAGSGKGAKDEPRVPIDLRLEALGTVQVCVVAGGEALIDGQMLAEGSVEEFAGERRYRIDLAEGGAVSVEAGDDSQRLSADESASWEANSNGIASIEPAGPDCP